MTSRREATGMEKTKKKKKQNKKQTCSNSKRLLTRSNSMGNSN